MNFWDNIKEKPCPYCNGTLIPHQKGRYNIIWICNKCPHTELLGVTGIIIKQKKQYQKPDG